MSKRTYIQNYYPIRLFTVLILSCVLLGCIPAFQIIVQRNLIDSAIKGVSEGGSQNFLLYLSQFIALALLNSLLVNILQLGTNRHNRIVEKRLDTQRIEKCNKVSFPVTETQSFHELCEQAEKAAESDNAFFAALQTEIKSAIQILTSFVVLFSIDARTTIVIFVLLFLGVQINKTAAKNAGNFWGEYIQNMRHANYLSSLLLHREYAMERKIFHYNPEIEKRYHKDCAIAIEKNSKLGRKRLFSECLTTLFSAVYSMASILLLIFPVTRGSISIGTFIVASTAIANLRTIASQFYGAIFDVSNNFDHLSGFFSLLTLEEEDRNRMSNLNEPIDLSKGIEFQHVSFAYPGTSSAILNDVSFTLKAGMHYALVGENGCGKTTLVKLLLGLYQPTSGVILVDGKDISTMSQEEKRQIFSAIFQDFYRYPFSIHENVLLSSTNSASSISSINSTNSSTQQRFDEIHHILDALHFDAPVRKKKNGLDINLGLLKQESTDLSGGEWQKLTVARSVLSPAQIIVLDEPNAAIHIRIRTS